MIQFSGKLSEPCQKYILRKETKGAVFSAILAFLLLGLLIVVIAADTDWIYLSYLLPLAAMLACLCIPPGKKDYHAIMPSKVTIDLDEGVVIAESKSFHLEESIDKAVSVTDFGEWYHIFFGIREDRVGRFVCQKDLICGGTIEEFEKVFEGKIVRIAPETASNGEKDWRLIHYDGHLNGKVFQLKRFASTDRNDHEHCEFCWKKITDVEGFTEPVDKEGYCAFNAKTKQ